MSRTYVIPDLHGRRDLLDRALAEIETHRGGENATLIVLGDYVDKGPDSRRVIARLRAGVAPGLRLAMLKGNHDALMVAALRGDVAIANWMTKGGDTALASYGGDIADVPVHDIDWLDGRPLWHMDAHRIYVHAGVDPALPLVQQDPVLLMTKRYADDDASGHDAGEGARHVVHGHDRHADGPLLKQGRSNLDTYAWKTGRLVIGVFDDALPGGPVELIEITAPPPDRTATP
ncbi:metallophosphoesterase [Tardiphaga sp. 709]|uniref:metallophosphoesterase n=1 Tax=Tardiphaga sp. 709 TaxID=3076039 RepID=UPI0028EBC61D|nr:metallophosphoesterase [Tardiphaga sp. 709]WNV09582.1 metallophosphoesterase [Tardiphaga sp. 709]